MKAFFLTKVLPAAVLAIALTGSALAQAEEPPTGGVEPIDEPVAVPLDGGASLLLAGGVAYGLKKLRGRRRTA